MFTAENLINFCKIRDWPALIKFLSFETSDDDYQDGFVCHKDIKNWKDGWRVLVSAVIDVYNTNKSEKDLFGLSAWDARLLQEKVLSSADSSENNLLMLYNAYLIAIKNSVVGFTEKGSFCLEPGLKDWSVAARIKEYIYEHRKILSKGLDKLSVENKALICGRIGHLKISPKELTALEQKVTKNVEKIFNLSPGACKFQIIDDKLNSFFIKFDPQPEIEALNNYVEILKKAGMEANIGDLVIRNEDNGTERYCKDISFSHGKKTDVIKKLEQMSNQITCIGEIRKNARTLALLKGPEEEDSPISKLPFDVLVTIASMTNETAFNDYKRREIACKFFNRLRKENIKDEEIYINGLKHPSP